MFDDDLETPVFSKNTAQRLEETPLFFLSCQYPEDAYYGQLCEQAIRERWDFNLIKPLSNQVIEFNQGDDVIVSEVRTKVLLDSHMTIVLLGRDTWRTYQTDWVLAASMSGGPTQRSGILGFILPTHPDFHKVTYNSALLPPRMADNMANDYVVLRKWSDDLETLETYYLEAQMRRGQILPKNDRKLLRENSTGEFWGLN